MHCFCLQNCILQKLNFTNWIHKFLYFIFFFLFFYSFVHLNHLKERMLVIIWLKKKKKIRSSWFNYGKFLAPFSFVYSFVNCNKIVIRILELWAKKKITCKWIFFFFSSSCEIIEMNWAHFSGKTGNRVNCTKNLFSRKSFVINHFRRW